MIDYVELRLYDFAGTTFQILQNYSGLTFDKRKNEIGVLNFSYPLDEAVTLNLDDRSLVAVACGYSDGTVLEVERYLMTTTSNDKVSDGVRLRTLTGRDTKSIFEDAVVYPSNWPVTAPAGHEFIDASPGTVFRTLILRAHNRGALTPVIETSFSGTLDSFGAAWGFDYSVNYSTGTNYLQIMQDLMDRGLIDVVMNGWNLNIYGGGTYGDHVGIGSLEVRPAVNVTELLTNTDSAEAASTVLIEGDEGTAVEAHSSVAQSTLGRRREKFTSQGGIPDSGVLTVLANKELELRSTIPTEETVGITDMETVQVFKDFDVFDWLYVRFDTDAAPVERRVYQIACSVSDAGEISIGLTLNSIIYEAAIKLQRQIDGYSSGGIAGSPTTSSPEGDDLIAPNPPTGVGIVSDAYETQGRVESAMVVSWTAPALNTDGTACDDLDHYDVQWKYSTGSTWSSSYPASDVVWYYSPLNPGKIINLKVRAVDSSGNQSAWTSVVTHTVASDNIPPAKPSTPVVTSRLGAVLVDWDGKSLGGGSMPPDFKKLEVHGSTNSLFTPTAGDTSTLVATFTGSDYFVDVTNAYNTTWYYRFLAIDSTGNVSVPSDVSGPALVKPLVDTDLIGQVIKNANIVDGTILGYDKIFGNSITGLQIDALAIDTGELAANAVKADKIDTGALTAFLVTGKQIETDAAVGYGIKITNSGIRAYVGGSTTPVYELVASTGSVTMKGTLTTGSNITGAVITGSSFTATAGGTTTTLNTSGLSVLNSGNGVTIDSGGVAFTNSGYGANIQFIYLGGTSTQLTLGATVVNTGGSFTASGGVSGGSGTFSSLSASGGLTVSSGGLTVSAGGATISAGGITVTGTSTFNNAIQAVTINGGVTLNGNPTWTNDTTGGSANVAWNSGKLRQISSTRRHKQNIQPLTVDLDSVYALVPRSYERIAPSEGNPYEIGFIAEEALEAGLDDWVTYDKFGQVESFDYYKYVVALQAAAVDLNSRVAQLESQITALSA